MPHIVIVGGGVIGLSVAYHLAQRKARDVVLLERNRLTSGTSWHAAGIVGPLRATPNMTRLASRALDLFPKLEAQTGMSTGYRRTGGYWLARCPERLDELHRIAGLGRTQGLSPHMIDPEQVALPKLDLRNHVGALSVPEDGQVNPVDLCMAYAKAARSGGVELLENTMVERLVVADGTVTDVTLADGTELTAEKVILCAGAWSRELAEQAGVALPLQAVEHMYVVTEPVSGLPDPFPVVRDLDTGIYIKGDTGKLVIGGFEPDAKCWDAYGPEADRPFLELPEDWEQFTPFMEAALTLMPSLATAGIQHFMNGPESFTADTRPLVGKVNEIDNLFVAAGMNSVGVMSSAGIGEVLADWAMDDHPPTDSWEIDVARVDPKTAKPARLAARMKEAVADLFALHWPYKQPTAGRELRTSALHEQWKSQGAVFGQTAGWERGLWYAGHPSERDLPYSVGAQPWHPIVAREASVLAQGAALLDLSPFTKIRVVGPASLAGLNRLSTAQLDVGQGRAVYTQFLNARAGIEMDVTVTRIDEDVFNITSGAATRWRDLAFLRRALPSSTTITDVTDEFSVIGVMGANSRNLLKSVSSDWTEVPFGHAAHVTVANVQCHATRLSFVGELGWELCIPNTQAPAVLDALLKTGARPLGHYAVDACRIEKGFKHWGHDLTSDLNPFEAGLSFTIDWTKDNIATDTLNLHRKMGVKRRLILLKLDENPLVLHDEPIYEHGDHVGFTTSGGKGARTGLTLAFGLVSTAPGEPLEDTGERRFEVEVAGIRYPAQPLLRPPFDPDNSRMRA